MTCWELEWSLVLELDEPALELMVTWVEGRCVAWWTTERGAVLRMQPVGQA